MTFYFAKKVAPRGTDIPKKKKQRTPDMFLQSQQKFIECMEDHKKERAMEEG